VDHFDVELSRGAPVMSIDAGSSPADSFPLLPGFKRHKHKIGRNPVSPFFPIPAADSSAPQAKLTLRHENPALELAVAIHERDDGRLLAEVTCTNSALLNKAAAFVGLFGKIREDTIGKMVPLNTPAPAGCSGTVDLVSLTELIQRLGREIAVTLMLCV
jgi:hypothetical protein